MSGILFFSFANCEPLTEIKRCVGEQERPTQPRGEKITEQVSYKANR